MAIYSQKRAWQNTFPQFPLSGHSTKPRRTGCTMLLDKGLGLSQTKDLLELAGDYIDIIKLTFGTSALYPEALLREKIRLIRFYGVDVYPGGTLCEIAILHNQLPAYLRQARELGFSGIEISDGTISLSAPERRRSIGMAKDAGFKVITEVGKKDGTHIPIPQMQQIIMDDLEHGADKVVIEGRESGKGVGIFDSEGKVKVREVEELVHGLNYLDALLWEAPLKSQQVSLIKRFGPNVNLGNIAPDEVLAVEALRYGLRGDTLQLSFAALTAKNLVRPAWEVGDGGLVD